MNPRASKSSFQVFVIVSPKKREMVTVENERAEMRMVTPL